METTNDEDLANLMFLDPLEHMEDIPFEGGDDSSYIDEDESITEYTTEEEDPEEDFSEEEIIPIPPKAEGKRVASPMLPGDQPLNKRPRQSTAEEDFDIARVVGAIEQNAMKMSHKAILWEEYENSLRILIEKVYNMKFEAREEEDKKNKKFRKETRKNWEEEKKRWNEMREHWEKDKKHREEEKKHREEMRKFMVAISKAFGVTA
ncbi:hypothetical protein T069G_02644 [Trichoderma breve]|uniref:Uncharacterized protein n=1 Tax=Trichoderma breve TaxID=2034170 RepID=A0A9W9BJW1_9HYPO|nr:hypothetical protein T069G_02644 [Trichoderma breve]KAJ4861690.1 hypothetical protein T069G_02644 [Trichoderma breve]